MSLLFFVLPGGDKPDDILHPEKRYPYRPPFNFLPVFIVLLILGVIWSLIFGYEPGSIRIEDIESGLSPEELREYRASQEEVEEKFEECTQYILYAIRDGKYPCLSCPAKIPFVTLKKGEIWYIGHTCQEDDMRHSRSFRRKNNVVYFSNYKGTKQECLEVELKLIRGYKYLPESQKPEGKLHLPPYNRTDNF